MLNSRTLVYAAPSTISELPLIHSFNCKRQRLPQDYLVVIQCCLVGVVIIQVPKLKHGSIIAALLDILDAQLLGAQKRVQ